MPNKEIEGRRSGVACLLLRCFLTHSFWNSAADQFRQLILSRLQKLQWATFWNSLEWVWGGRSVLVERVQHARGEAREPRISQYRIESLSSIDLPMESLADSSVEEAIPYFCWSHIRSGMGNVSESSCQVTSMQRHRWS